MESDTDEEEDDKLHMTDCSDDESDREEGDPKKYFFLILSRFKYKKILKKEDNVQTRPRV